MSTILNGGCLCGAVRYRASVAELDAYYCHCRMCQLAFGNTHATFFNLPKEEVTWLAAAPSYFHSSKFARRGFCGHCGTPLSFEYLDSKRMDLSVGSLDDPGAMNPTSHFAIESRIASFHVIDGLPEQRLDEHQAIMQRWMDHYGETVRPGPRPGTSSAR